MKNIQNLNKKYFKTNSNVTITTSLSIITLKGNGLNDPVKRHRVAE